MSWIETVAAGQATGRLRDVYARVAGPDGPIDNILRVHSLRPHTLEGHLSLYKAVLHHNGNRLPRWILEAIGVHVSRLNACGYCVDHHAAGLRRLLGAAKADVLLAAIAAGEGSGTGTTATPNAPAGPVDARLGEILRYATRLTLRPSDLSEHDIAALRAHGLDDGEVLEINQVVSYFAYANRTVLGLGVTTHGDVLGLAPANQDDAADWRHA